MTTPLDVFADLSLLANGEGVQVSAEGDTIVVDLPSLRAGSVLLGLVPAQGSQRAAYAEQIQDALRMADLTAEMRVQGDTVVRLGAKARPGAVSRLLQLGPAEVRPATALSGAVRRRPGAAWAVFGGALGLAALIYWRSRE